MSYSGHAAKDEAPAIRHMVAAAALSQLNKQDN
jgi:hypothetical protein